MNPILKWLLMWFVGMMNCLLAIFCLLMEMIVFFELMRSIDAGNVSEIFLHSVISIEGILAIYIMARWLYENDEYCRRIKF